MKDSAFGPGLRAVRHSVQPLLLIQAAAVAAVVVYYKHAGFRAEVDGLQTMKVRGGVPFAALSTAFSGAILPVAARLLTRRPAMPFARVSFQFFFFGFIGITVDLLYRLLANLLGPSASIGVVIEKVAIDQLLYSPLISIPISALAFLWESAGFSFAMTGEQISSGRFGQKYRAVLVTCWCYWIPVLACVYSLPSNLQFILFLCCNGAWSLLLVFISSEE